ncbi:hypothetical protein FGB62_19g036 [Gracilaria domingensis]|nr:hypothetical protein FGB62_19g036 [Gracilaria domingensis]
MADATRLQFQEGLVDMTGMKDIGCGLGGEGHDDGEKEEQEEARGSGIHGGGMMGERGREDGTRDRDGGEGEAVGRARGSVTQGKHDGGLKKGFTRAAHEA